MHAAHDVLATAPLQDFHIKRGDRIAQMILERIEMADVAEVQASARSNATACQGRRTLRFVSDPAKRAFLQELDATERGAGGFGSTGGHGSV